MQSMLCSPHDDKLIFLGDSQADVGDNVICPIITELNVDFQSLNARGYQLVHERLLFINNWVCYQFTK